MSVLFNVSLDSGPSRMVSVSEQGKVRDLLKIAEAAFCAPEADCHSLAVLREEYVELDKDQPISEISERELILVVTEDGSLIERLSVLCGSVDIDLSSFGNSELTEKSKDGKNLLHYGAMRNKEVLDFLLQKNLFDIDVRDSIGQTPLLLAAQFNSPDIVLTLLNAGADIKAMDSQKRTFLHHLCMNTWKDGCNELFSKAFAAKLHPFLYSSQRSTAAHYAALSGNTNAMQLFIEKFNFPLDLVDGNGDTCLHLAAKNRHLDMIQLLRENGADFFNVNNNNELPIDYALENRNERLLDALTVGYAIKLPWDLLEKLKNSNEDELLKFLELKEAQHQAAKLEGATRKRSDAVAVEIGSPLAIRNAFLFLAAARMQFSFLNKILSLPNVTTGTLTDGNVSLLNILTRCSNKEQFENPEYVKILDKILSKGCRLNSRPLNGNGCLHTAALNANLPAIQFCLDNGAFLNCGNKRDMLELHFATISGSLDIVKVFLNAGSDPNLLLKSGHTCAEYASIIGQTEIGKVLEGFSSKSMDDSVFKPNAATFTIINGRELLAKDDNGLSDPYVTFRHHCGNVVFNGKTSIIDETLNPEWNESFTLIIKQNNVFYRDIPLYVFDYDEPDGTANVDDLIGRGSVILDPRTETQHCTVQLQDTIGFAGIIEIDIKYLQLSDDEINGILKNTYEKFDSKAEAKQLLKAVGQKSVGKAKKALGYLPKFPVMIVPGFASSALECWQAQRSAWVQERVWLDPFKIGHTFVGQALANKLASNKKKSKSKSKSTPKTKSKSRRGKSSSSKKEDTPEPSESNDESEELDNEGFSSNQRIWLQHLLLDKDGVSDPPGITVRPVPGIHGTDYLIDNPLAKAPSYVFGHLIKELADVGYTSKNLDAATYDWRIPPSKLEERDGYFTQLKMKIEFMRIQNKEKVVILGHSMGNRCAQYFLSWADKNYPGWLDENVHAFLAMGPPFLGASKTLRAVVSGDCCSLEAFLTPKEGRAMHRALASVPWLLPIQEENFPDIVTRVSEKKESSSSSTPISKRFSISSKLRRSSKKISKETSLDSVHRASFKEYNTEGILDEDCPTTWNFYKDYYQNDPFYLGKDKNAILPPVLLPPPVQNLWVVIGTNLSTEVSYYFKPGSNQLVLDSSADQYSGKKIAGINPRGLKITGGIGFETKTTYQPSTRVNKSGDGTVPYCSLNLAESNWRDYAARNNLPIQIQTFEIEGAEHREMLCHGGVTNKVIDLVCIKPIG